MSKKLLLGITILLVLMILPNVVSALNVDVALDKTNVDNENCGGTVIIKASITERGWYGLSCWYGTNLNDWTKGTSQCISRNQNSNFDIPIEVPSSGQQTKTIYIACRDYNPCTNSLTWADNYYSGYPKNTGSACIVNGVSGTCLFTRAITLNCQQHSNAQSAIKTAEDLINTAQTSISSARSKIKEAIDLGADVISAQASLQEAESKLSTANTYLSNAKTQFSNKNYPNAQSLADNAKNEASTANSKADNAKNMATQAIQLYAQQKTEVQSKISAATIAISTAQDVASKAEGIINDAKNIGLDTVQAEADISSARASIESSQKYLADANSALTQKKYEEAKQLADTSKQKAESAEALASGAYNNLEKSTAEGRVAAQAISDADKKVSQMNSIIDNFDYIIENVEDKGMWLTQTKEVIDEAKSKIDTAEDLLSSAKNRAKSGDFDNSANTAIEAKNMIDIPYNRLDTMAKSLAYELENNLEQKQTQIQSQISATDSIVAGAATAYGAEASDVVAAQNAFSNAKNDIVEAGNLINQITSAGSIENIIKTATNALQKLDSAGNNVQEAKNRASAAKFAPLKTGAVIAGIAAAGGGGFLYWRKRKKGKHKKHTESFKGNILPEPPSEDLVKPEESKHTEKEKCKFCNKSFDDAEKIMEHIEKDHPNEQLCPNCDSIMKKSSKFCSECGEKI